MYLGCSECEKILVPPAISLMAGIKDSGKVYLAEGMYLCLNHFDPTEGRTRRMKELKDGLVYCIGAVLDYDGFNNPLDHNMLLGQGRILGYIPLKETKRRFPITFSKMIVGMAIESGEISPKL